MNERKRIKERCTSTNTATQRDLEFDEILKGNGYPPNFINETKLEAKQRTVEQHHPNDTNPDKWLYFSIPYISDNLDRRLKNIFRNEGLNVRVTHRSQTMRNALKRPAEKYTCKIVNCPVAVSKKCFQRGVVYEITCAKCGSTYIGSTIRHLHDRIKEHLSFTESSVYSHLNTCSETKEIRIKVIARDRDPINLRLLEALYIKSLMPTINSRDEHKELQDLLF